ncbi:hypothetical protein ACOSP7_013103 [Xanthoceras sorbifolium]
MKIPSTRTSLDLSDFLDLSGRPLSPSACLFLSLLALRRSHAVSLSHGYRWSSRRFSRSSFCCPCVEGELVKVFANEHKKITCEIDNASGVICEPLEDN